MKFIERLKSDRKLLLITLGVIAGIFFIPYLAIPALVLWWFYKKSKFSKRFKTITTASVLGVFALLLGWASIMYAKDAEPHLTISEPPVTSTIKAPQITIKGRYSPADRTIEVNGQAITAKNGSFQTVYQLKEGDNIIDVQAGNWKWTHVYLTVTRQLTDAEIAARITPTSKPNASPTSKQTQSYKIVQTMTDYDSNKQLLDMSIYATENPPTTFNQTTIKTLIDTIKTKECKIDDCDIQLYDDEHLAQESYAFDKADATSQAALDDFDTQYPDFNNSHLDIHFVAEYIGIDGTLTYYPLQHITLTPAQASGYTTTSKTGATSLYPNYSLTPGEVFPNATASQVCTSGYSSSVRNVSTSEKEQVFAEYGIDYSTHANYEVDHFISLELGGDNSIKNLWPEPGASPNQKDKVENYLHSEVCSGKITLAEAQKEISTDWYKVYLSMNGNTTSNTNTNNYVPPATNITTTNTSNTSGTTTTSTSNTIPAGQPTGKCNDGTETTAVNHQGACSHHGGVAYWY